MTNWIQIFTGSYTMHNIGIHQVRTLVFDKCHRCPVSLNWNFTRDLYRIVLYGVAYLLISIMLTKPIYGPTSMQVLDLIQVLFSFKDVPWKHIAPTSKQSIIIAGAFANFTQEQFGEAPLLNLSMVDKGEQFGNCCITKQ